MKRSLSLVGMIKTLYVGSLKGMGLHSSLVSSSLDALPASLMLRPKVLSNKDLRSSNMAREIRLKVALWFIWIEGKR